MCSRSNNKLSAASESQAVREHIYLYIWVAEQNKYRPFKNLCEKFLREGRKKISLTWLYIPFICNLWAM